MKALKGKKLHELVAQGSTRLAKVSAAGKSIHLPFYYHFLMFLFLNPLMLNYFCDIIGAPAAAASAPAQAPVAAKAEDKKKEEKKEEEADVDMGGLFGDEYWSDKART